jgi:hypothetical protein
MPCPVHLVRPYYLDASSRTIEHARRYTVFVSFLLSCMPTIESRQELDPFAAYSLVHHCVVDPVRMHASAVCHFVFESSNVCLVYLILMYGGK